MCLLTQYLALSGADDSGIGIDGVDECLQRLPVLFTDQVGLVEQDDIGKLKLVYQQVGNGPFIVFLLLAVWQVLQSKLR